MRLHLEISSRLNTKLLFNFDNKVILWTLFQVEQASKTKSKHILSKHLFYALQNTISHSSAVSLSYVSKQRQFHSLKTSSDYLVW